MIRVLSGSRWRVGAAILSLAVAVGGCTATSSSWPEMPSQGASDVRLASLGSVSPEEGTKQPLFLSAYSSALPPRGFHGVCDRYAWACSKEAGTIADDEALRIALRVNRRVNARIRPVPDHQLYGMRERWTLPERGAGDCEDFALLKKKLLLEAGLPGNMLLLATGLNRRAEPHAVLVLRLRTGDIILDNLTSAAKPWQETGYTFLKIQSADAPRTWSAVLLGPFASRA